MIEIPTTNEASEQKSFAELMAESNGEFEQTQRELKEIALLLQQSTAEVEKLAQLNAQNHNKISLIEGTLDSLPRQHIVQLYKDAQETQSRLFTMRGQVEQLQNKQQFLERYAQQLKLLLDAYHDDPVSASPLAANASAAPTATNNQIMNIITAQENERLYLSKALHDGPAQSLTNLILQAEICERLFDQDANRARDELGNLKEAVNNTFKKIREYIFELRPMILDDLGLIPTLRQHIQDFNGKYEAECKLNILGPEQRLPPHVEVTLFRVVQSLLNNVRDHANATNVEVNLDIQLDKVMATVIDNGSGFDVKATLDKASEQKKMGILSVREQITMLQGEINFDSNVGMGTTVNVWLPLHSG